VEIHILSTDSSNHNFTSDTEDINTEVKGIIYSETWTKIDKDIPPKNSSSTAYLNQFSGGRQPTIWQKQGQLLSVL
jgi:hypothetical protein